MASCCRKCLLFSGAEIEAFTARFRDEMAAYDLPASLAHALAVSNASRLAYVGHSQGTTIALAALASQPALAAQVSLI